MNNNFGEELAYWYLRLNGFFTVHNFVLHHNRDARTSDADLLAVRFPYVYEETGGNGDDWDPGLFESVNQNKILGLICEVKTGLDFAPGDLFKETNLSNSLGRFGFVENLHHYSHELAYNSYISIDNYEIHKVLISRKRQSPRNDCLHLRMTDIQRFIKNRMQKYMDRKMPDRMFFPSSLLQYMIWDESLKNNRL